MPTITLSTNTTPMTKDMENEKLKLAKDACCKKIGYDNWDDYCHIFSKEDRKLIDSIAIKYNELMNEEYKDAIKVAYDLAEWSRKYPRWQTYPMAKISMDDELIALEKRAKQLPTA